MSHFPPVYLTVSRTVNAPRRLESLRATVAMTTRPANMNSQNVRVYADWRAARSWTFANGAAAFGVLSGGLIESDCGPLGPKRAIWYCHTGPQFRDEKFCDEVEEARIDHTGWFTRDDGGAKIRGIVARLSHGRFIAGYYSSDNDERVYLDRIYTEVKEAANDADSEAERVAESEREYNERWDAAHDLHDKITRRTGRIAELFALRNNPKFRATARDGMREQCAIVRKIRAELAADYSDISI